MAEKLIPERRKRILSDPKLPRLDMSGFRKALGDLTPSLTPSKRGRIRLIRSLEARYGGNFRQYEVAKTLLDDFDDQSAFIREYLKLKGA